MGDFPESEKMEEKVSDVMTRGMDLVDLFVNRNYLIDIDKCDPVPLAETEKTFSTMSLFQIDKIVYDVNENINDKLVSVYSALSNFGSSAILVIASNSCGVSFYLGTRDKNEPYVAKEILKKSLKGNFPGIHITEKGASEVEELMQKKIPEEYTGKAVAAVSIVPGMRDEDEKDQFVQGIEKFIDSMAGEEYTAVFISSPLGKRALEDKKRGYEELYSALSQCAELVMTYGENESDSVAEGISSGFSKAVNDGISDTTGKNSGVNKSRGRSTNSGFSVGLFGSGVNMGGGHNSSRGSYHGTSESHTENYSETETTSDTKSSTDTRTTGSSASLQITRHNKTVEELMKKIDEQLERIKNCESYGLWDSASYFIADKRETAIVAANTYKALVAGEKTGIENSFINIWGNEFEYHEKSLRILDYIRYGIHPRFLYLPEEAGEEYDSQEVTAASMISGVELPIMMGLPHKSVSGVTSIESVEFGRNVFFKDGEKEGRNIDLGAVYHLGEVFENNRVRLNLESLSAHCFICGSTGSGKSNTTYKMIDELTKPENHVKFLVVEPAKGEYKLAFGGMPDINIFTTNPNYYSMLSINPFEFNEEIHVLEHLDRLIEIFSACWPLYAAMPAVLKASFERAYVRHGWDLNRSVYIDKGNGKFPDFKDVLEILPVILNESDFSADTKGDYIGSLVTRVESLTNGLVGQIFNGNPVDDEILFDQNTIVDLSRVGSTETKALIMGVLVLKLSEYRQSTSKGVNLPLHHVTIMEEAHNLLKRTSTEQGQESANVQGKSVEMISNSIAEMRTYGEGFIIVDQSPTAVDISAIKNTNTKIVMRLPEASDCEAAGHSIGLKDEQIMELGKLDKGVAAVFQNDWLETVLTKIDKCSDKYEVSGVKKNDIQAEKDFLGELLEELVRQAEDNTCNLPWLKDIVKKAKIDNSKKHMLEKMIDEYHTVYTTAITVENKREAYNELIAKLLNCADLIRMYETDLPAGILKKSQMTDEIQKAGTNWIKRISAGLESYATFWDKHIKNQVLFSVILNEMKNSKRLNQYKVVLYCAKHYKC